MKTCNYIGCNWYLSGPHKQENEYVYLVKFTCKRCGQIIYEMAQRSDTAYGSVLKFNHPSSRVVKLHNTRRVVNMPVPLIILIVQAVVEIIKLIIQLRKTNPVAAEQCSVALREARKFGDTSKLGQLLDALKKNGQC